MLHHPEFEKVYIGCTTRPLSSRKSKHVDIAKGKNVNEMLAVHHYMHTRQPCQWEMILVAQFKSISSAELMELERNAIQTYPYQDDLLNTMCRTMGRGLPRLEDDRLAARAGIRARSKHMIHENGDYTVSRYISIRPAYCVFRSGCKMKTVYINSQRDDATARQLAIAQCDELATADAANR